MAIPSRGIGWGTEENLLWQISKQIEKLTCVTAGGCGSITTTTTTTLPVYRVYSALLNQSGTSDPTAIVNENTIGAFTLTRNSTGIYYLTSPGFNGFPDYGKVLVFLTNGLINRSITGAYTPPINGVIITTGDLAGIPTDGYINNCSIEIRLYN